MSKNGQFGRNLESLGYIESRGIEGTMFDIVGHYEFTFSMNQVFSLEKSESGE